MGFVRSRDGRHQALYLDPSGKRRSAGTFNSKRAAERALLAAETSKASGRWIDPNDGRVTFSEYVELVWLPNRVVRPSTTATESSHLNKHLLPTFGAMPLAHMTPTVIQAWVTRSIRAGASPRTVHNIHGTLRSVLRRAAVDRYVNNNAAMLTELPLVPATALLILTPEQVDRLLLAVDPSARVLLMLLTETGMRWGESQALKVSDVDFMRRMIVISRSLTEVGKASAPGGSFVVGPTKSNRLRRLKVSEQMALTLAAHVEAHALGPDDLLVGASARRPHSRGNFHNRIWSPARKAAGLGATVRIHDLRHTHASWLLAGGADLKVVMDRLGWSNLATAQRYLHTMPGSDDVALDALDRVRARAP